MQPAERLGGRVVTDHRTRGPVFDVVGLAADGDVTHLAMLYPEPVRAHPWLAAGPPAAATPRGSGVAPLVQVEPARGALVYETGPATPLAEILGRLARDGRALGIKASLELAARTANILVHAEPELGPHGQVNPWTITLDPVAQPVLIGHAVPCLELDLDHSGSGFALTEDALRYAPPERFGPEPVDLRSDLFALWLIVAEGVLGRPLYDGVLEDLRHQTRRGDALARWAPHRDLVSPELDALMAAGLKPDADTRRSDPDTVVRDLFALAQRFDADGPKLVEVLASLGLGDAEEAEDHRPRTLYDPRTAVTEMDRPFASFEEEARTEVVDARERDARREALRERLKAGPSATTAIRRTDLPVPADLDATAVVERPGAPAAPADVAWRLVSHGGRAARVPVFADDRVATVALRAAVELGAIAVDTSGKLLGGFGLGQGGRRVAGDRPAAELPHGSLELVPVATELRLVTVEVVSDERPDAEGKTWRFQSPTSLGVPAAWFVAGIVAWLRLPDAPWAVFADGAPVDGHVLLADVLGDGDEVLVAPLQRRR